AHRDRLVGRARAAQPLTARGEGIRREAERYRHCAGSWRRPFIWSIRDRFMVRSVVAHSSLCNPPSRRHEEAALECNAQGIPGVHSTGYVVCCCEGHLARAYNNRQTYYYLQPQWI